MTYMSSTKCHMCRKVFADIPICEECCKQLDEIKGD
jgi:hypothetical protein